MLCTYWRLEDPPDPGTPQAYRDNRAQDAEPVIARIEAAGGRVLAVAADPSDPATPEMLFSAAERELGPVDILVNNATGWLADTFAASASDRHGRLLQSVTAATWTQQFTVDAMAAALMISEFACRHIARGADWGLIIGLTSIGELGFAEEVSYGAAKAAQVNYTMSAALELAPYGITANMVYPPVTDAGWVTNAVRQEVAARRELILPRREPGPGCGRDRLARFRRRRPDHGQRHHPSLASRSGSPWRDCLLGGRRLGKAGLGGRLTDQPDQHEDRHQAQHADRYQGRAVAILRGGPGG